MSDFSSRPLVERYNGDWAAEAEGHFMRLHGGLASPPLRFGLDRPSLDWGVQNLPKFVRNSPDYLLPKAFVEVYVTPKGKFHTTSCGSPANTPFTLVVVWAGQASWRRLASAAYEGVPRRCRCRHARSASCYECEPA